MAVFLGQGGDVDDRAPRQRDLEPLPGRGLTGLAPGGVPRLADREGDAFLRQLLVVVDELASGVRLAHFLVVDVDRGLRDRRPLLRDDQGEVARGLKIGVEGVLVDGSVFGQLHQKAGLPGLDAVAGQLLGDEHLDFGPGLPLEGPGKDSAAVGDSPLLPVHHDLGRGHGPTVHARFHFEVQPVATTTTGRKQRRREQNETPVGYRLDHGCPLRRHARS